MIISELIDILQRLPQESKIVENHFYRLKNGGIRQNIWDIVDVTPCYDQDTNRLDHYSITSNIKITDIK